MLTCAPSCFLIQMLSAYGESACLLSKAGIWSVLGPDASGSFIHATAPLFWRTECWETMLFHKECRTILPKDVCSVPLTFPRVSSAQVQELSKAKGTAVVFTAGMLVLTFRSVAAALLCPPPLPVSFSFAIIPHIFLPRFLCVVGSLSWVWCTSCCGPYCDLIVFC
ncbi:hypothetical protein CEXT_685281 [Caerostris extrusa]|uniref:Uncharacterized protein n=1 Tax=Caerostris extrusa TaxID=172846 RepID=A0AAV4TX32_CAEEX|nr:hypothetical protein CEXT_685281 [Caerostris extrusa]